MSQEISLVKAEAINGNKSALIESGLSDLLDEFKGYTANQKVITATHIKSGNLKRALEYLGKKKVNEKTESEPTSLSIIEVQDDGTNKETDLTIKRLKMIWSNPSFTLKAKWADVKDFLSTVLALCIKYEQCVTSHHVARASKIDTATEIMYGIHIEKHGVQLGQSLLPYEINAADREFIYDHLRTNSGELYWFNDDKLYPIFYEESTGAISNTCEFLDGWNTFAYPFIKKYADTIMTEADLLIRRAPTKDGLPEESFDKLLSGQIPRVMLQNTHLIFRTRVQGDKAIPDGFEVGAKIGQSSYSMALEVWRNVFRTKLLASLKRSSVQEIKQFSNTPGQGLTYVSLEGVNVNGNVHATRPELPKNWKTFFFGETGKTPMFACDVEMSLLRVAYFVSRLVTEDSYTRQILFCAGGGNDGKTVFCETISKLIGEENAISLNPNGLDNDGTKIGLLNKSFIYMPDAAQPSTILDNPTVKQLTGRDTMPMRRLYCSPFNYTPEHAFVAVTTNKTVYAKGIHQTSRVLPLTFQINYLGSSQKDPEILKAELLSERTEFLQWCFDMLRFYRDRTNKCGEKLTLFRANGLTLLTDDAYNQWLNSTEPSTSCDDIQVERKIRLRQELEALNNGPGRFVALSEEDSEETDADFFGRLVKEYFIIEEGATCARADIQMLLIENEKEILIKACGFKTSNLNYCQRYRSFLKYLASLDGVSETIARHAGRVFKGIKIRINSSYSVPSSPSSENDNIFDV